MNQNQDNENNDDHVKQKLIENLEIEYSFEQEQEDKENYSKPQQYIENKKQEIPNLKQQPKQFFIYYSKKLCKINLKNIIQIIISLTILYGGYYLYTKQIQAYCDYSDPILCLQEVIFDHLKLWILYIFLTSLSLSFVLIMTIFYRWHIICGITSFILTIYLLFIHHGSKSLNAKTIDFQNYQAGVTFTLLFFLIIETIITLIITAMKTIKKKSKKAFYYILIFSLLFLTYKFLRLPSYCKTWDQGLVSKIDYGKEYCIIEKPTYCWNIMLDGLLDFSGSKDCENQKSLEEQKEEFYDEYNRKPKQGVNYLGWKSFKNIPDYVLLDEQRLSQFITSKAQEYETMEQAFDNNHEIIVDIQKQELFINVQRDEKIVEKRKKAQEKNKIDHMAKNIIAIFIDTVSRQQVYRKLPKSAEFLKKYANFPNNNNQSSQNNNKQTKYEQDNLQAKAFEFFRFHAVDKYTYNNEFVLNFADDLEHYKNNREQYSRKIKSLLTKFQDAGYILAHANNGHALHYPILNQRKVNNQPIYRHFDTADPDHQFLFYDPMYFSDAYYYGLYKGSNSIFRRCAYNRDTNYFLFDYGLQFLDQYKEEKKVLFLEFQDSHEATSEVLQYMDDNLYNFFTELEQKQHIQDETILLLFADHGNHFTLNPVHQGASQCGDKCSWFNNYLQERMLPMFFMMVSNDILQKYQNNLISNQKQQQQQQNNSLQQTLLHNQQPIFGMWQVRNTLLCAANGIQSKFCQDSLFTPLDKGKSCKDIKMRIAPEDGVDVNMDYCVCFPREE